MKTSTLPPTHSSMLVCDPPSLGHVRTTTLNGGGTGGARSNDVLTYPGGASILMSMYGPGSGGPHPTLRMESQNDHRYTKYATTSMIKHIIHVLGWNRDSFMIRSHVNMTPPSQTRRNEYNDVHDGEDDDDGEAVH